MYGLTSAGKLAINNHISLSNGSLWLLCSLALMGYTLVAIYTSKTTLTETELQQTWIWHKEVPLKHIAYAKFIRVKGFDWLIAPRLYIRTMMGKFIVFYTADAAMIQKFEQLVKASVPA
jgi:hypothetical protein